MDNPDIFDKSIYINEVNKNKKLSDQQKECMIKIINDFYNIYICLVHENIIFCVGYAELYNIYHCVYIINDEYFIKKYLEYAEHVQEAFYTFKTIDDELIFNMINTQIHKYGEYKLYGDVLIKYMENKLCEDVLIKYSECKNIISLFSDNFCYNVKIGETIKKNVINELMNANIIIDHDTRDKIIELLSSDAYIHYNYNVDDILNNIFGFIPKATQFSFVD